MQLFGLLEILKSLELRILLELLEPLKLLAALATFEALGKPSIFLEPVKLLVHLVLPP